jgi:hypothetical protein
MGTKNTMYKGNFLHIHRNKIVSIQYVIDVNKNLTHNMCRFHFTF